MEGFIAPDSVAVKSHLRGKRVVFSMPGRIVSFY
ncbi:hypothetical protein SAMN05518861_108261 [Mesorhizobium sp. YR577]|jgi:hypothetical protein|nr:hypothetical protein SAMN05518861_108261 [Mesorhizobium sp. YR577]